MQKTVIPGVFSWSVWQPERGVFFNSHFIQGAGENLIVDPLPLDENDASEIEEAGGVTWVVVTNRDHERAALEAARRFGARIAASGPEAPLLQVPVDRTLSENDTIGPAVVVALEGMKSPCEIALRLDAQNAVLVGDGLWGAPAGALSLPPRVDDASRAILSLRKLRARKPLHLLVGDGASIFYRAYAALNEFFETQTDALASRLNMDELTYLSDEASDPPGYRSAAAEIGYLVGATVMGYQAARVPPGQSICPAHWHVVDEELFVIWEGSALLHTPQGSNRVRRGDLIAFPANERGTHKLTNDTDEVCIVLMIASNEGDDVCSYPDSGKVLVTARRLMLRDAPSLDYFDGET